MMDYSFIPNRKPNKLAHRIVYTLMTLSLISALLLLNGCGSTEHVLAGLDYACIDVQGDGYFTDSGIQGRGIVIPEGETLTPETIAALCE
jgi:hypothetical protein